LALITAFPFLVLNVMGEVVVQDVNREALEEWIDK
jgi:hypothetical protein